MKDNSFNEIGQYWRKLAELNEISNNKMNQLYDKFMTTKDFKEWENKDRMDIIFSEEMFNKFMDFYKKEMGKELIVNKYPDLEDSKNIKDEYEIYEYNGFTIEVDGDYQERKRMGYAVSKTPFDIYTPENKYIKSVKSLTEAKDYIDKEIKAEEDFEKAAGKELLYRTQHAKGYDSIKDVKPRKNETKEEFISRFMKETEKEYPNKKQRAAIAYSYWNRRNLKDSETDFYNALFKYFENNYGDDVEINSYNTEEDDYLIRIFDKKNNLKYDELKKLLLKEFDNKFGIIIDWIGMESGWYMGDEKIPNTYTVYYRDANDNNIEVTDSWEDFDFTIIYEDVEMVAGGKAPWDEYSFYVDIEFNPILDGGEEELAEVMWKILSKEDERFKGIDEQDFYDNVYDELSYEELNDLCKKYYPKYKELFDTTFEDIAYRNAVERYG